MRKCSVSINPSLAPPTVRHFSEHYDLMVPWAAPRKGVPEGLTLAGPPIVVLIINFSMGNPGDDYGLVAMAADILHWRCVVSPSNVVYVLIALTIWVTGYPLHHATELHLKVGHSRSLSPPPHLPFCLALACVVSLLLQRPLGR